MMNEYHRVTFDNSEESSFDLGCIAKHSQNIAGVFDFTYPPLQLLESYLEYAEHLF